MGGRELLNRRRETQNSLQRKGIRNYREGKPPNMEAIEGRGLLISMNGPSPMNRGAIV